MPCIHAAWPCAACPHAHRMAISDAPGPAAGGRASSREVSLSAFSYLQFDHGCQFITASTPVALEQILDWERRGEHSHLQALCLSGMPAAQEGCRPSSNVCCSWLPVCQHSRQAAGICRSLPGFASCPAMSEMCDPNPSSVYSIARDSDDCPVGFLKHWKGRLGTYDAATCAFKDRTEEYSASSPDDQGFCNILCQGDIYVGSYCMVDACSAMYQLIGIEVKWDERVSKFGTAKPSAAAHSFLMRCPPALSTRCAGQRRACQPGHPDRHASSIAECVSAN